MHYFLYNYGYSGTATYQPTLLKKLTLAHAVLYSNQQVLLLNEYSDHILSSGMKKIFIPRNERYSSHYSYYNKRQKPMADLTKKLMGNIGL